jgi:hypothetical protein
MPTPMPTPTKHSHSRPCSVAAADPQLPLLPLPGSGDEEDFVCRRSSCVLSCEARRQPQQPRAARVPPPSSSWNQRESQVCLVHTTL